MTTERTPKRLETWTSASGIGYVCTIELADDQGQYVWTSGRRYVCLPTKGLTPPPIPLPEVFVNVDADDAVVAYTSREEADAQAWADRVAVLHLHPDGHTTIDRLDGRGEQ